MNAFVVDASVWVSALLPHGARHRTARRRFDAQAAAGGALVSPVLLLSEVGGAIARQTKSVQLATAALRTIEAFPGLRPVPVDHRLGRAAAERAARLRSRGADAIHAAVALHLHIPLVTLDAEQRDRARTVLVVGAPAARGDKGRQRG